MSIVELANERFSCRKFTDEAVSESDLFQILEAVRLAPSACNRQPWKFVVVESEAARLRLCACYDRPWFRSAPLYIIAMRESGANWVRPEDGKEHGDIDVAIAVEHLCLAAAELGLGTCWVCNFDVARLQSEFGRDGYEPVAVIPLGHIAPTATRPAKTRKSLEEIMERV